MAPDGLLDAIDLIYSAAINPAGWEAVLMRLADMTGCIAGGLTIEDTASRGGRPITFFGFDPDHVRTCFDHFLPMNPLFAIEAKMQPGFVVTNGMVVDERRFRRSAFYDGWARPQGLCSPLSLVLHREAGRYIPLTLVRPDGAGDASADSVALLKTLSSHLIRAMDIGLKIGQIADAEDALQTCIDTMPVGIVLLDAADRVLRVNHLAEQLFCDSAIDVPAGGIVATRSVQRALAAVRLREQGATLEVLLERAPAASLSINVVPVSMGESFFNDGRVATMLVLRSADTSGSRSLEAFATRYGLSGREQTLLKLLAVDGLSLANCAVRLDITLPTVKTHLQRIFDKTHARGQTELLAKLFRSMDR